MRQSRFTNGFQKGHKLSPKKGHFKGVVRARRSRDLVKRKRKSVNRQMYGWEINRKNPIPIHKHKPEGTIEELTLAYNKARGYQLVVMNYADKDMEIPPEVLAEQRRIFHFAKNGPNYNKFIAYGNGKLLYADVLYILSCKVPASKLAKTFNVSLDLIKNIRQGRQSEWLEEYELVLRIKRATYSKHKKNFLQTNITVLRDEKGNTVQHFSSIKKAKEYRRHWLMHNQKIKRVIVDDWISTGKIDKLYPIEEATVIT